MPTTLDELFETRDRNSVDKRQIVGGTAITRDDGVYARVDGSSALWGPLLGAETVAGGDDVVIAIDQEGQPWVVGPGGGGATADCCTNVDGGRPDSIYGGMCNVDGDGVVRD